MIPIGSFIDHFNLVKQFQGARNSYNKKYRTSAYKGLSFLLWILLIPLKVLDILGVFYIIDLLRRLFLRKRCLTAFEREEVFLVFGDTLPYEKIRIVENSFLAKMGARSSGNKHLGFVLFRTINFTRPLNHEGGISDMSWLIHELVHVRQFEVLGVQYIFEALRAQRNGGYNYGGIKELKLGNPLHNFNLEQQADVARHYYQALKTKSKDAIIFEPYIAQIKNGTF